MKKWSRIGRFTNVLILLVGMAFLFPGCEKPSAPPPFITTKRQKKKIAKTRPPKKVATPEKKAVFSYNPRGLADPFKPFVQIGSAGKTLPGVPKTPLQKYNLSQLTLTAIIWTGDRESRAMVRDSAGKGFTLKKGTYIGRREGKVKAIHLDRVIIEEPVRLYGKQSKPREVVMKMPVEGGKK